METTIFLIGIVITLLLFIIFLSFTSELSKSDIRLLVLLKLLYIRFKTHSDTVSRYMSITTMISSLYLEEEILTSKDYHLLRTFLYKKFRLVNEEDMWLPYEQEHRLRFLKRQIIYYTLFKKHVDIWKKLLTD